MLFARTGSAQPLLLLLLLGCWAWALSPSFAQEAAASGANETEASGSHGFERVREWAKQFQGRIPGSKLSTAEEVARVRGTLACLAQSGRWVLNPDPRPLPWPYSLSECDARWMKAHPADGVAGRAANGIQNASLWNIRTGLKYEWQASERCGHWQRFDPSFFCSVMRKLGGPLVIAGDSLAGSQMESIHNLLQMSDKKVVNYFYTPHICQHWEARKQMEGQRHLCQGLGLCKVPIVRVRNDRLSRDLHAPRNVYLHGPNGARSAEFFLPWLSLIKTWGAKAVLLNRGAHYTESAQFAEELELAILVLRERYPDLLILYRATAAGHDACETMEVPLERAQDGDSLPYHWGGLKEQNGMARRIVEKYGGVFLDIEPMTELRGDGHRGHVWTQEGWRRDCLHYCSPGPVDEWTRLLQNALSRLV